MKYNNFVFGNLHGRLPDPFACLFIPRKTHNKISKYKYLATKYSTEKYYIQSAFALDTEEKRKQELNSLSRISDNFRKIVIEGNDIVEYTDINGIRHMGLFQFLIPGF